MKTITLFIAMLVLSISACAQKASEPKAESNISAKLDTTVPWLQIKIWDYESRAVSSPPRSIIKTTFEGKPVYYVPPVCCDIPGELYADDGKLMCYPNGGFTGAGDSKCPMFMIEYWDAKNNQAKDNKATTIWQDKTKPVVDTKSTRVVPNLH